jgi:chromosome segregation ATPase
MSDMSLKEALSTLKNQGRGFKAVMIIADAIESVDDLERQIGEANARLIAKRGEEAMLDGRLSAAGEKITAAQDKAHRAEADAISIVADAKAKASETIDAAKREAQGIITAANEDAKSARDKAAKDKAAAASAVNGKASELDALDEKIVNSSAELVEIEARIEKAREAVKQMMGG